MMGSERRRRSGGLYRYGPDAAGRLEGALVRAKEARKMASEEG